MGKKLQGQVKELTAGVAEAELGRDEARASAGAADAKANELGVAVDEGKVALTQSDRARKLAESEKNENTDRLVELQALYTAAANGKRKADDDFHALHEEMEELENAAQAGTEKAAKAAVDVGRLAADLASANAATANAEKSRGVLAKQVADLQLQLEEIESGGGRGVKSQIRSLELKIMELESDLDTEARRTADVLKTKLQTSRFQLDEAEAGLSALQTKYKKAALEAEEAEKRCESAELALLKARQRAKSQAPSGGASRQRSRMRTPAAED